MRDRNAPLTRASARSLAWEKMGGCLPAVVQDHASGRVLMLGYMDEEALAATFESGLATFYSRSKGRLWQKGETSGNRLHVRQIYADCDDDALLLLAEPAGPTCHLGSCSCFEDEALVGPGWLADLAAIVRDKATCAEGSSYTRELLEAGTERIAQKIGEEGVEVALAAVSGDAGRCAEEIADLTYHLAVLMQTMGLQWQDVIGVLRRRHVASAKRP
ncbi:MAG: bifunctional phosphoribosyl-AMP cyclohydrolase/phosphoribosyl-ATP diphosphatase HisIE [Pseudomonadota bacterium]|nr:bifunctional phosphoribosyl-AMP cyclohydrolase/phosphoribosyl-ATP diphosphatase HisIE [Pseudomonadota bacterium]